MMQRRRPAKRIPTRRDRDLGIGRSVRWWPAAIGGGYLFGLNGEMPSFRGPRRASMTTPSTAVPPDMGGIDMIAACGRNLKLTPSADN
jgi:hypothetical protein